MRRSPSGSRSSEIRNPDGSIVFRQDGIEVPEAWSQVATDVLAQKYFRKAGVPARLKRVEENAVPSFLWRAEPDETALAKLPEDERYRLREFGASRSSTGSPAAGPIGAGRAATSPPRRTPRPSIDELRYMLADADVRAELAAMVQHRPALGLRHRRPGQGHYYVDHRTGELVQVGLGLRASAAARLLHPGRARTTSSTRAASWTCGSARRACSSTAPAPARTSRRCAARASSSPAAGARPA